MRRLQARFRQSRDLRISEEKKTYNEGCLSFPGIHADVARSLSIRMRYMDTDFVEHDEEFTGLKAWVIQHEYDHIEGVVFTDRIAPLRRQLLKGKTVESGEGEIPLRLQNQIMRL